MLSGHRASLFWVVYGDAKLATAIALSGILGLAVITVGFRKDLQAG